MEIMGYERRNKALHTSLQFIACFHSFVGKVLERISRMCQRAMAPYPESIHDPDWLHSSGCQMIPALLEPEQASRDQYADERGEDEHKELTLLSMISGEA